MIFIPFIGTLLGAAGVFILRNKINELMQKAMTGFAAGVMIAACFWSLLSPALENSKDMGKFAFVPAMVGFMLGVGFLLLLDMITPHRHMDAMEEGPKSKLSRNSKMFLAVTIHNIPEGMAVGVVYAGIADGLNPVTLTSAMALAIGIAIQNIPEGAIISMMMKAEGSSKSKSFLYGALSGAVEPAAAALTMCFAGASLFAMPYLLSFAAGAMMYVVVEELIPEMSAGKHSNIGTIFFSIGFVIMMILEVVLG